MAFGIAIPMIISQANPKISFNKISRSVTDNVRVPTKGTLYTLSHHWLEKL